MGGQGKLLLLILTLPLTGCSYGWTHNPVSFPNLPIFGDIVRTHSKPAGEAYFRNYDRYSDHLEVVLQSPIAAVQSRQVILVSVLDCKNKPLSSRCVEWTVEGAGSILEVDESGLKPGRGYKVDSRHAVSYTDYFAHTLKKFNGRAEEDIPLKPGQTWCVISSMTEGDTQLSIWAPEIANWDENRRVVTIRWVDAEWVLPPIQAAPRKSQPVLSTLIRRRTDRAPVAGYRIRYRILDGAPAVFAETRGAEAVVSTDEKGTGTVSLLPAGGGGGRTRVGIDIIRPADPSLPSGPVVVIGQGETAVDWEAPVLSLEQVAPASISVGQDMTLSLLVANKGSVPAGAVSVRAPIPEGMRYVSSEPQAVVQGNYLVWRLPGVPGRGQQGLRAIFRGERVGPITSLVSLHGSDGEREERSATIQVLPPEEARLVVEIAGPRVATLNVGDRGALPGDWVTLQVTVRNVGTGVAQNVQLLAELNEAIQHESGRVKLRTDLEPLSPGQARTLPLPVRPVKTGAGGVRVTAFTENRPSQPAEHALAIREAGIVLKILGPTTVHVGRPITWDLEVTNLGTVPVSNVTVQDRLPAEMEFVQASGNALRQNGELTWMLGNLEPRQQERLKVTAVARRPATKLLHEARVVARPAGEGLLVSGRGPAIEVYGKTEFNVIGTPALKLQVRDSVDPITVGGATAYRIDVTNEGSSPVSKAQVTAALPVQMKFVTARGPTQHQQAVGTLTFAPLEQLQPGQTATYFVEVTAIQAGDARLRVELLGGSASEPLIHEESTNVR